METGNKSILKSILLLSLFLLSLFAAAIQPPSESTLVFDEIESTSGGARHLYTFADGSSEAIALYQSGTPARNIQVTMPKGAEVTGAEVTISGIGRTICIISIRLEVATSKSSNTIILVIDLLYLESVSTML